MDNGVDMEVCDAGDCYSIEFARMGMWFAGDDDDDARVMVFEICGDDESIEKRRVG